MNDVANKQIKDEEVTKEMHIVEEDPPKTNDVGKKELSDKSRGPASNKSAVIISDESMAGFSDISNTTPSTSGGSSADLERKPKKRKTKCSESSDPIYTAIYEAINKIISQKENTSAYPEELTYFIEYLGCGIKQIKNKALLKKCKREMLAVLYKHQDEDEKMV